MTTLLWSSFEGDYATFDGSAGIRISADRNSGSTMFKMGFSPYSNPVIATLHFKVHVTTTTSTTSGLGFQIKKVSDNTLLDNSLANSAYWGYDGVTANNEVEEFSFSIPANTPVYLDFNTWTGMTNDPEWDITVDDLSITWSDVPVVSGVSSSNPIVGGVFTISGANFTGVTAVKIGSTAVSYTVNGSSSITVPILASMQGYSGAFSVTNSSGTGTGAQTWSIPAILIGAPTPANVHVSVGGYTRQFTQGTVSNSVNTAVNWSTTTGSINSSGLLTSGSTTGTFTVTNKAQADTSKSASVNVIIDPLPTASLSASTQTPLYGATVNLISNWSGYTAYLGTSQGAEDITNEVTANTEVYTLTPQTYWLRAINAAGQYADSSVTITPQTVVVAAVTPASPTKSVSTQTTFSSSVSGAANSAINWSCSGGSITAAGVWTAPAAPGNYTITATSAANTSKSASTTVTVVAAPTASLTASSLTPLYGGLVTLTCLCSGSQFTLGTDQGEENLANNSITEFYVDQDVTFDSATFWLRAYNAAGDYVDTSVTVIPQTVVVGDITGGSSYISVGYTKTLSSTVSGSYSGKLNWSGGGSFSPTTTNSGASTTWTAPSTAQTVTITATSYDKSSISKSINIQVVALPTGSLTASTQAPAYGATNVTITPICSGSSAILGTSQGASDISTSATSGTAISVQSSGFITTKTYWLRVYNLAGQYVDSSITITAGTPKSSGKKSAAASSC